jgi:cytochrome c oxidase cbb3-type subunit III
MKNLLRILTAILILLAIPIALFAFFPRMAEYVNTQAWGHTLWMIFISIGILALFIGLDLLNRVNVYKAWVGTPEAEKEAFWKTSFTGHRVGFLRTAVLSLILMAILLFFMVFYLVIIPKSPEGSWYLWVIKVLGCGVAIGGFAIMNAIMNFTNGKKVILGIDEAPIVDVSSQPNWVNRMLQIKPSFLDAEVDLKEDFDGITELDNPPPPWFMFIFYSTVLFAGIYLVRYTWLNYGMSQNEEYKTEYAAYTAQKDAMKAKMADNVDENNVTVEKDKAKLAAIASLFTSKCGTCHGENGQGINGPNLTDEYWIHGNSVKDIFKTIKYGVLDKGMLAWKDQNMSPANMRLLTSYILSLQGSKPAGAKAEQGEKLEMKEKF